MNIIIANSDITIEKAVLLLNVFQFCKVKGSSFLVMTIDFLRTKSIVLSYS